VEWERTYKYKEEGGLGLKDIKLFTRGQIEMEIGNEKSRFILESKYEKRWSLNNDSDTKHESLWWKDIRKVCREGQWGNWFEEKVCKIGFEIKIRFWEDETYVHIVRSAYKKLMNEVACNNCQIYEMF